MRRLSFRWQQTIPRLLLVVVALLGAQYALGLAARWIAIRSGEVALAAKVDVGAARFSLLDRQVVLGDLRVANPVRPSENFLQADRCELDFAVGPLLDKRAIIDRGRVVGLRIGQEASGAVAAGDEPKSNNTDNWLGNDADVLARQWLAQLSQRFKQPAIHGFESFERSEALCARWPGECAALNERAAELKRRAVELQQAADAAEANRLRHAAFFSALPSEASALQHQFDELGAATEKCSASLEVERRAIVAARQRDERLFREGLQLDPIDANSLTAYLLREQLAEPLGELIGWLRWARRIVPAEPASPRQQRGEDVLFSGCRPAPSFLIRTLELQGTARLGAQSVELNGLLTNVTNVPSYLSAPMRLRLTSGGSLPLEVQATIDRTGGAARDELLMDCRGVTLPDLCLGRSGGLELRLAPSTGSLSISIAVENGKLTGDIQLVQKKVRITPVLQGELADVPLIAPLQNTLGKVDFVATRLSLDGTIDEPSCRLWSNLGPAVAEALDRALRQAGDKHADIVLADARRQVDERLADLERRFAAERTKLGSELVGVVGQVEALARRQTPGERISVERLGGRLPEDSLFR